MKAAGSTILSVLLAMTLNFARAEWRFDAETGGFYDSNLSNSDRSSDEEADWAWKTDLRIGNGFQLSRDLRLNLVADLRGHLWDQYNAFNEIGAGASASLRYRFGLGPQAHGFCWRKELATIAFKKLCAAAGTNRFVFAAESQSRNGSRSKPAIYSEISRRPTISSMSRATPPTRV